MPNRQSSSYSSLEREVLLQPWFLPKRVAHAIHKLLPPASWKKMGNFFDDYGCMICATETGYHSNGMCKRCFDTIHRKLLKSVKRHSGPQRKQQLALELFRQERLAKKLLGKLARSTRAAPRKGGIQLIARYNPIYEALVPRFR